ncbi:hypothetical protein HPB50_012143 [Hyalomma asiaticum]|uniref:Uncharacterized protein n=1 Tax=Hyalomma asiaticum TaxID=266040 RepID=A0ACB7SBW8_HYAAI|nr:hypothetical protein HPB50_012143 [Hyalomma asiaticum]
MSACSRSHALLANWSPNGELRERLYGVQLVTVAYRKHWHRERATSTVNPAGLVAEDSKGSKNDRLCSSGDSWGTSDRDTSIVYTAVARGKVALPCDISPPTPDDSVTLVLWYKDESLAPIFTLDSRRAHVDQARQSLSGHGLDHRAHFNMANQPAFLQIDPVEEADAGEYRCRVDFRRGRSINTVIHLNVIGMRDNTNRYS